MEHRDEALYLMGTVTDVISVELDFKRPARFAITLCDTRRIGTLGYDYADRERFARSSSTEQRLKLYAHNISKVKSFTGTVQSRAGSTGWSRPREP
ncbi:MAG TPA: hypothetical protein VGX92_04315 [Pyrinomonadaceae bacterium]|nr:hypothetical protein [Pyrinomonadaceae bacterium]